MRLKTTRLDRQGMIVQATLDGNKQKEVGVGYRVSKNTSLNRANVAKKDEFYSN